MSRILDFDDGFETNTPSTPQTIPASDVSVTPSGNLGSSTAQSAFVELQTDIDSRALSTDLSAHSSSTTAHGATGAVVGTTNVQTLTNKTLTSPVINSPTGIVKADVGLGNVDNTSDATKNSAVATLTNKTLTAPVISTISNTGTLTLPTSTDILVGRATTDTLTNKNINGSSNTITNVSLTSGVTGTLPVANGGTGISSVGSAGNVLTSNGTSWVSSAPATSPVSSYEISNLGLAASVSSNAMTIAMKQSDGSTDASSGSSSVKIGFRSSTLTSGAFNQRSVTGALSLVVSSGSTLGTSSGFAANLWVYAIDNAGTVELAVSQTLFLESSLVSTTAEGGAGAADSVHVMYSTTARSNVPCRLIGKLVSTQTTAGTWAAVPTAIAVGDYGSLTYGHQINMRYTNIAGTSIGTGNQTLTFPIKDYDSHSRFSSNTTFTAPSDGKYSVKAKITANSISGLATCNLRILVNGSTVSEESYAQNYSTASPLTWRITDDVKLSTGDTVTIQFQNGFGSSITMDTGAGRNSLAIARLGD